MNIEGSCYCGEVKFSVISHTPYPYMHCYCSFCRKTSGSGGYGINIMAQADSLSVQGKLAFHHGMQHDPDTDKLIPSEGKRFFCCQCGSPLWAADPRWPDWIYPYASAVNTPLPKPPEIVHIMLEFAASWVEIPSGKGHRQFDRYPDESIEQWHKRHGLYEA